MRARGSVDRGRVKPAPFEYVRPTTVGEVIDQLRSEDVAQLIAGGQSLVQLMAMRLARPTLLIDVNDLDLDTVELEPGPDQGFVRIGATTRHRRLEVDPVLRQAAPLLADAAALIGHPAIRARGTIGGSLAHADPLAELPAVLVVTDGSVVVQGPSGERSIAAADLFAGFLTTTLEPDEMIVAARIPVAGPRHGAAFCEWAPRAGDFAVAGIAVVVERDEQRRCASARAAAIGVGSVPLDCSGALASAIGATSADDGLLREVSQRVRREIGGDDDRAELVGLLAARAVFGAFERSWRSQDAAP
ncbi:MAG: aerobic carbon-monoxide dehydrogenase medium subunit [Actinomycetota bacterium]|nr:aerobic carbon-monoxide dehydrogenase medium subunit [Actinomycetota bacterium]